MPSQYSQSWARGFSPFRGSEQQMRLSDSERQEVADRLAEHFSAGRLDQAEFDERVGRAMLAKTRADLAGLFDDLPETGAPAAPEPPRRARRHPVLLLALVAVLAIACSHVLWWAALPLAWIAFLVLAIVLATRAFGHCRAGRER